MPKPITWDLSAAEALKRARGRLFATVTETSVILGYDREGRTVRKAIDAGEIPHVRVGATRRIPVSWIIEQARLGDGGGVDAA
jgi:excisionase family DNA binding protein